VADERDAPGIDVLPLLHVLHNRPHIVRVIRDGRRFVAAAALSDPALVEANHQEAGIGDRVGQLREDRHPGNGLVSIDRRGSGHEDHRRPPGCRTGSCDARPGDGSGQREAAGLDAGLFVCLPPHPFDARRHGSDVVAGNVELLRRDLHPN
jgi:hypothetical protein